MAGEGRGVETIAQRFVKAFGGRDHAVLDGVLAEDVMFYGTLAWGQPGRQALKDFADQFHEGNPGGLRVALHDEFYSADGTRGSMRVALHFHNTGHFFGKEPSGKRGVSVETFTAKIQDDKITELVQGGNTLTLGYVEVVDLGLPFPTDTPEPEITSASAG